MHTYNLICGHIKYVIYMSNISLGWYLVKNIVALMPLYINFVFTLYLWVDLKVNQTDSEDLFFIFLSFILQESLPPAPPSPFYVTTTGDRQRKVTEEWHTAPQQAARRAARQPALTVTCQCRFSPDKAHVLGSVRPVGVNTGVKRTRLRDINQVKAICQPQKRVGCRGRWHADGRVRGPLRNSMFSLHDAST